MVLWENGQSELTGRPQAGTTWESTERSGSGGSAGPTDEIDSAKKNRSEK